MFDIRYDLMQTEVSFWIFRVVTETIAAATWGKITKKEMKLMKVMGCNRSNGNGKTAATFNKPSSPWCGLEREILKIQVLFTQFFIDSSDLINRRTFSFWFVSIHFPITELKVVVSAYRIVSIANFNLLTWNFFAIADCTTAHNQISPTILCTQSFVGTSNMLCIREIFATIFACILLI